MFNNWPEVLKYIQKDGFSVAEFSKATGISADRIHKWKAERGVARFEDTLKLIKWSEHIPGNGISTKIGELQEPEREIKNDPPGGEPLKEIAKALKELTGVVRNIEASLRIAAVNNSGKFDQNRTHHSSGNESKQDPVSTEMSEQMIRNERQAKEIAKRRKQRHDGENGALEPS